ncbi:MAG: GTPase HflX [Thermobacillus sp. ZCTH02-B1]|uniref:GTPase HflX n=1 Tax=Thermobacillus sp. ZCTH02-B1 TaxID=1858795 RepID=UPI000B575B06|nr:GTPase HflX [Thermobacillus sp. ZCTH02-B1]OUM96698.1 MAG: GTPase HflX [Thermobacillus sp. ZCTH02-B1]
MTTLHETTASVRERAILVSLVTDAMKRAGVDPDYSLRELVALAETAGVEVLTAVTQHREAPDPKYFIGKGKVEELRAVGQELGATMAIFDQELSGAQVRNLEEGLDLKIIDRTQLILDIFAQRARTREGIIQVELAQLSYLLPRLSGHGRNLSRLGGGIGTRGPGETKLETDRRHIRERIADLKRQLAEVMRHRGVQRERRRKTGVTQVALVGYTNAGKSTLLRELTNADVYVENQLFATLDPTSRAWTLPDGTQVVLTDTVGFIQNLPHELVAAFRSTLEEAAEADLILHVVDSSSPYREEQMAVVDRILTELGAGDKPRIVLYNKIDLCPEEERPLLRRDDDALLVCAFSPEDRAAIGRAVQDKLSGEIRVFAIPCARGDLIALAHRMGEVVDRSPADGGETMRIAVRLNRREYETNGYKLKPYALHDGAGSA